MCHASFPLVDQGHPPVRPCGQAEATNRLPPQTIKLCMAETIHNGSRTEGLVDGRPLRERLHKSLLYAQGMTHNEPGRRPPTSAMPTRKDRSLAVGTAASALLSWPRAMAPARQPPPERCRRALRAPTPAPAPGAATRRRPTLLGWGARLRRDSGALRGCRSSIGWGRHAAIAARARNAIAAPASSSSMLT